MTIGKKGFTLIEVLVVVAITAIIAAVVIASVSEIKKKGRTTQRLNDLQQLELALRLYKDANGQYPLKGCGAPAGWVGPGPQSDGSQMSSCDDYIAGLAPAYIPVLPRDPSMEDIVDRGYLYWSNGTDYKILQHGVSEKGNIIKGTPYARCPASCSDTWCSYATYSVYSSGAKCL